MTEIVLVLKCFFGLIMMTLVTGAWVGATQCLKSTYTGLLEHLISYHHLSRWNDAGGNTSNATGNELQVRLSEIGTPLTVSVATTELLSEPLICLSP